MRFLKKNSSVGLIGIDYMQLLSLINKKNIQRQEELKQICLMLKDCAVETGLPILYSYAAQAQLQLLVFCEFSNQSIRLAQEGSVLLTKEWWIEKAMEAGLNPEKISAIIEHLCQPDFFNCFLERYGDEYRLASYYNRQQKFLENQGIGRIKNSEKGKNSVEKRNVNKFKKS